VFQKRAKNPKRIISLGMFSLAFGGISFQFARYVNLPSNLLDGVNGFFYGVGIAFMLLGIRLKARPRSSCL